LFEQSLGTQTLALEMFPYKMDVQCSQISILIKWHIPPVLFDLRKKGNLTKKYIKKVVKDKHSFCYMLGIHVSGPPPLL
jgi:hypothetical protein